MNPSFLVLSVTMSVFTFSLICNILLLSISSSKSYHCILKFWMLKKHFGECVLNNDISYCKTPNFTKVWNCTTGEKCYLNHLKPLFFDGECKLFIKDNNCVCQNINAPFVQITKDFYQYRKYFFNLSFKKKIIKCFLILNRCVFFLVTTLFFLW